MCVCVSVGGGVRACVRACESTITRLQCALSDLHWCRQPLRLSAGLSVSPKLIIFSNVRLVRQVLPVRGSSASCVLVESRVAIIHLSNILSQERTCSPKNNMYVLLNLFLGPGHFGIE